MNCLIRGAAVVAVAVAVLPFASPSWSQAAIVAPVSNYSLCDGYGQATKGGDGMTKYATSLGVFNLPGNGNTLQGKTAMGVAGVQACDAAIATLPLDQWMRHVSLLRARAIHHLQNGDPKAALADLDEADQLASGKADAFYERSLGLGNRFIRAYALRVSGDAAKADAMAVQAANERPFFRQSGFLALLVVEGRDADQAQLEKQLQADAAFNPSVLDFLFQRLLVQQRYAEAAAFYPNLVPPRSYDDSKGVAVQNEESRGLGVVYRVSRGGEYAYLLAALGRPDEARAAIAAVRSDLARSTEPPPAPTGVEETNPERAQRMMVANMDLRIGSALRTYPDTWANLIDLRLKVDAGQTSDVLAAITAKPLPPSWATADLFDAIGRARPDLADFYRGAAQKMRDQITQGEFHQPAQALAGLWSDLPEPETPERLPTYRPGGGPLLALNAEIKNDFRNQRDGYRSFPDANPGVTVVRYRATKGTAVMIEEMAMLRAAELARQAGKGGFIIVGRHDAHFTLTTYTYGTPVRTDPTGFETEIDVVFVDPHALPAPYDAAPWRVQDAGAVYAALSPIYGSADAPKAP